MINSTLHQTTHLTIMHDMNKKIQSIAHHQDYSNAIDYTEQLNKVTADYHKFTIQDRAKFEVILKRLTNMPISLLSNEIYAQDSIASLSLKSSLALIDIVKIKDSIVLINSIMTFKSSHINKVLNDFKSLFIGIRDLKLAISDTKEAAKLEVKLHRIIDNLVTRILDNENTLIFSKIRYSLIPRQQIQKAKSNLFVMKNTLESSIPVFNSVLNIFRSAAIGITMNISSSFTNLAVYSMMTAGMLATVLTYPIHALITSVKEYKAISRISNPEPFIIEGMGPEDIQATFSNQAIDQLSPPELEELQTQIAVMVDSVESPESVLTTKDPKTGAIVKYAAQSDVHIARKSRVARLLISAREYTTYRINLALDNPLQFLSTLAFLPPVKQVVAIWQDSIFIEPDPLPITCSYETYIPTYVEEKDRRLRADIEAHNISTIFPSENNTDEIDEIDEVDEIDEIDEVDELSDPKSSMISLLELDNAAVAVTLLYDDHIRDDYIKEYDILHKKFLSQYECVDWKELVLKFPTFTMHDNPQLRYLSNNEVALRKRDEALENMTVFLYNKIKYATNIISKHFAQISFMRYTTSHPKFPTEFFKTYMDSNPHIFGENHLLKDY